MASAAPGMTAGTQDSDTKRVFHFPTVEEERRNAAQLEAFSSDNAAAGGHRGKPAHGEKDDHSLQSLLIAEDICVAKGQKQLDLPMLASAPVQPAPALVDANIPPLCVDADRALLEQIAQPAIDHPRLPAMRLCEIALELCKNARMLPSDFSDLLKRKYNVVRDKILPTLRENPNIHELDNTYYYL